MGQGAVCKAQRDPRRRCRSIPGGGVGQGCAGKWCGRDARGPGGASTTQECGDMIYVTLRNGARGCLQGPKRRKAPLPFHPRGGVGQGCAGKMVRAGRPRSRVDINHPRMRCHDLHHAQEWGTGPFARPKEPQGPVAVPSQRRSRPGPCREKLRAGRPRSRVGINHPTNREHDLRHAREWGTGLFANLRITPPVRGSEQGRSPPGNAGVPPATLFLAGGRGAVAQGCRQAVPPAGVNGNGQSE